MVFDFFLFFISLGALCFSFSGYLFCLALLRLLKKTRPIDQLFRTRDLPPAEVMAHILVPTFNEAPYIADKIDNLLAQDYTKMRVWICDGGSSDATIALAQAKIAEAGAEKIELLHCRERGKILQINEALARIGASDVVIISDADALCLTFDAISRAVGALGRDPEVGLIGGWTNPENSSSLQAEIAFWDKQNRARYMETIAFSSSIVVAPFYAFRRSLLTLFPEDCVADDVYISYVAHLKQVRVIYTPDIPVIERRSPQSRAEFIRHKFRKTHAYTTELFRVLHRLPYMRVRLKFFYLTKLFQFFYLPWFFLFLFIESWILSLAGYFGLVASFYLVFLILILLASATMKPPPGMSRGGLKLVSFVASVETFLVVNLVLILNSVLFPFWRQNSSYARLTAVK